MGKLTARRARFVDEYVRDPNAAAAAVRAGFSENGAKQSAHRLLQDPDVAAEIRRRQAVVGAEADLDAKWVLKNLRAVAEQDDVTQATKVRAIELVGKHLGMFTEKHEHDVRVRMTPADRAARVAALLKKENGGV